MSKQEALSKEEFSVIYLAHYDAMKRYAARAFTRPDGQTPSASRTRCRRRSVSSGRNRCPIETARPRMAGCT